MSEFKQLNANSDRSRMRTVVLFVALFASSVSSTGFAQGIVRNPDGFSIALKGQAQEAVENGVALTFNCEFAMLNRFLFFTWAEERKQHSFVVTHHALSNRYIVKQNQEQRQHSFRSLDASMNHLAAEAQRLFSNYLESDSRYEIRLSLSKFELPGPIRLSAFLANDWDLDTGWVKWESES